MNEKERMEDVGRLLGMVNNGIHRRMEQDPVFQEMEGMTGKNSWIIGYLSHHPDTPVYQKDIEKAFNITRSTASKVLTLMEKKGFIERRSVKKDARLKQIVLTEKAIRISQGMERNRMEMEEKLTRGFSEEEKEQLSGYLNRILKNLCEEYIQKEETNY